MAAVLVDTKNTDPKYWESVLKNEGCGKLGRSPEELISPFALMRRPCPPRRRHRSSLRTLSEAHYAWLADR